MSLSHEELLSKATEFMFLPEGADITVHPKDFYFAIIVKPSARGKWIVTTMSEVWNKELSAWEFDSRNSSLNDKKVAETRFSLDEAVQIAHDLTATENHLAPYSWEFWLNHPERTK
ncbi:MAG: hypothetical protein H9W81_08390 [Enterococcus sp.]|nr:hypothetical protein [Enterococcus sp.]